MYKKKNKRKIELCKSYDEFANAIGISSLITGELCTMEVRFFHSTDGRLFYIPEYQVRNAYNEFIKITKGKPIPKLFAIKLRDKAINKTKMDGL